jgi:hypothetical protein
MLQQAQQEQQYHLQQYQQIQHQAPQAQPGLCQGISAPTALQQQSHVSSLRGAPTAPPAGFGQCQDFNQVSLHGGSVSGGDGAALRPLRPQLSKPCAVPPQVPPPRPPVAPHPAQQNLQPAAQHNLPLGVIVEATSVTAAVAGSTQQQQQLPGGRSSSAAHHVSDADCVPMFTEEELQSVLQSLQVVRWGQRVQLPGCWGMIAQAWPAGNSFDCCMWTLTTGSQR